MCSSGERSPREAVARLDARGCFDAFDGVGFDDGDDDEAFAALDGVRFEDDDEAFEALDVGFDNADEDFAALDGVGFDNADGAFEALDVGFDNADEDFAALDGVGFDNADGAGETLDGVDFDDADEVFTALDGVGLLAGAFVADLAAAIFFVGFSTGGLDLASCFAGTFDFLDEEDFLRAGCLELRLAIVGGSIRERLRCEHATPGQPAR